MRCTSIMGERIRDAMNIGVFASQEINIIRWYALFLQEAEPLLASVRLPPVRRGRFLIAGGLYSVTALRENDQERATVYTKHGLKLQALVTEG